MTLLQQDNNTLTALSRIYNLNKSECDASTDERADEIFEFETTGHVYLDIHHI